MNSHTSIFGYFEKKFDFNFKTLDFRFPIETFNTLLKRFYRETQQVAFLLQAKSSIPNLALKKISKLYHLQIPLNNSLSEQLYIGLSDSLCFLVLFDEEPEEHNISKQRSRFYLTFEPNVINAVFGYFYKNYCGSLSIKEKKLLIKLKNIRRNDLDPSYLSKFQEALLISALSDNNKIKQAKIVEALSYTDESVAITDLACNIKEANKNFKLWFDKKHKGNIKDILPDNLFDDAMKETTKKGQWQGEVKLTTSTSKAKLLQLSCYLFKDELERPNGYVFTFKNITDLKKLDYLNKELIAKLRERNLQLNEVNKRLVEADRIKSDLLSVVSHELKTPISTILGFSELLSSREYDISTVKSYADQITSSAKYLDRTISDYLDVASNQFGVSSGKLYTMPVNLGELIRICYNEEKIKFPAMKFQLELNSLGYEPIIITEAENMKKLFCNLINNSFKYSPEGGKISIKILNDRENVTISVADQGIGITSEQARKVFEPFYRADNSVTREFSGIGLGLAVCKKIVEMYGGSIWCEPGVDMGTVFYISLPVNPHVSKPRVQEIKLETNEKLRVQTEKDFRGINQT